LLAGSVALAAPGWMNADWACRAKVTAYAGQVEHQDQAVEQDVDFAAWLKQAGLAGALDPNSPRVTLLKDGQEKEVPCRFFPDKDNPAKGRLSWLRPGVMAAGAEETYYVYFDAGTAKPAKTYPELAKFTPLLGKNLALNGDLETADKNDPKHADVWQYDPVQESGAVERVKGGSHSGDYSLKVTNAAGGQTTVTAHQPVVVEPGKRYVLSGWARVPKEGEGGYGTISVWFSGKDGQAVPAPGGGEYGNHKNQIGVSVQKGVEIPWTYFAQASINVFDPKTQTNHPLPDEKTAPGTFGGSLQLDTCYGKAAVYFDDIEFRELAAGMPIGVLLAAVEKKP